MIDDIQIQTGFFFFICTVLLPFQFILPAAHGQEAEIGFSQNPVKIGHLNVRLEFDFPLSAKSAASRISECAYPFVLLFHCLHLALLILHCLICGPVRIRRMVLFAVFLINLLFLLCQLCNFFLQFCFGRKGIFCLCSLFEGTDCCNGCAHFGQMIFYLVKQFLGFLLCLL